MGVLLFWQSPALGVEDSLFNEKDFLSLCVGVPFILVEFHIWWKGIFIKKKKDLLPYVS